GWSSSCCGWPGRPRCSSLRNWPRWCAMRPAEPWRCTDRALTEVGDSQAIGPRADNSCMTTIRARCPHCGEVDMAPDAIELAVRGDTGTGSYRFICPACMTLVQKRADQKIVDLLSSVGVSVATPSSPSLFEGIDDVDVPAPSGMFEMPFEPRKPSAPEGPGRSPF